MARFSMPRGRRGEKSCQIGRKTLQDVLDDSKCPGPTLYEWSNDVVLKDCLNASSIIRTI